MQKPVNDLRRRFAESLRHVRATSSADTVLDHTAFEDAALEDTALEDAVFDELIARYTSPDRHYHSLAHVSACLGWLDWLAGHAERPAEVALALWLHDAVYDPRRDDNESQSAALARDRLPELGVGAEAVERIAAHVLATHHHEAESGDSRLVVDIDLTILGAPAKKFEEFERQIRSEYAHVPDAAFDEGRRRVLKRFLGRPSIYRSPPLHDALEDRARDNLRRRLAALSL